MLTETTRPLTPDEVADLLAQVRGPRQAVRDLLHAVAALAAVAGVAWWAGLDACFVSVLVAVAVSVLSATVNAVGRAVVLRARARRVLAAGQVVEYAVTSHAAARLASGEVIFDVGDNRLFCPPMDVLRWRTILCGVFRLALARPANVELNHQTFGIAWFYPRKLPTLRDLVPDAAARRRVRDRLREQPAFRGTLDDLAAALRTLGDVRPPLPPEPGPPRPDWDAIQAHLEIQFHYPFGVGRLAAAVGTLAAPPTPAAVAGLAWSLFPDPELPPANGGTRRRVLRQLRDALAAVLQRSPESIALTDRLDALFPAAGRRRTWAAFRRAFGAYRVPRVPTDPPGALAAAAACGVFSGGVLAFKIVLDSPAWFAPPAWAVDYPFGFMALLLVSLPLFGFALAWGPPVLLRRLAVRFRFPANVTTVGDLLQHALDDDGLDVTPTVPPRPAAAEVEAVVRDRWDRGLRA